MNLFGKRTDFRFSLRFQEGTNTADTWISVFRSLVRESISVVLSHQVWQLIISVLGNKYMKESSLKIQVSVWCTQVDLSIN
jgi:hypothetical protein